MELRNITYFLRIVETGSLSKAAESLYLTQPTLSRFLSKLEDELGVTLFRRSKSTALELTEAGKLYLETARKIDRLWKQLDEDLESSRRKNRIVFGIYGDHLQEFASECARKVMEKYPGISVDFLCDGSLEIQRLVAEGELRIGLCAFENRDPRLCYHSCGKSEMNLVMAPTHPLANRLGGKDRISLHALPDRVAFALMRDHTVLRETVEGYLHRMKYTPNLKRTYMRHGSIVGILTGEEPLLGFCPANNRSDRLVYMPLDPPFYYCQGVCWQKNETLSPAEAYLAELLQDQPAYRDLDSGTPATRR